MRSRKRFGQHFLTDVSVARRILTCLHAQPGDPVLEIGPGRGALTRLLVEQLQRVAAVEIDRELSSELRARYDERSLILMRDDVLRLDLAEVRELLDPGARRELLIVGNLPYNISKPIAMKLIRERSHVQRAVLMFQLEVAQRLIAKPGGPDYGPLSVLAGQSYAITKVFELGPGAFRPRPKVRSAVTHWERRLDGPDSATERRLRQCLAVCFRHRRQTLRRNLAAALGDTRSAERLLTQAQLDGGLRAQEIAAEGFLRLADSWDRLQGNALI